MQIVDAGFKSIASEIFPQFAVDPIVSFRNKVERGTKTAFHFQFHQLPALANSRLTLDIVCQNEGEFFSLGPAGPAVRQLFRARQNGPDVPHLLALSLDNPPADDVPGRSRDERLEAVIECIAKP